MRQLSGKSNITLVICFLTICIVSASPAEEIAVSPTKQQVKRPSSQVLSRFLTRSNSFENLPDITNKKLREMALRDSAREFLGDQSESLKPDAYFFSDTAAEGPWFQGWYTRIVNTENGDSIAVIAATQYLATSNFPMPYDMSLPGYLAVIVSDQNETKIYEAFPARTTFSSNRDLVLDDPKSSTWEEFFWSSEFGSIAHNYIDITIPGKIDVYAELGPRLPYNANIQWLGPEGLVEFLPMVPLHWFVYSLGSEAEYIYTMLDENNTPIEEHSGVGYAHQESNWGDIFPPAWIWSEGINTENSHQFALSGGELSISETSLTTWLIAYHSPRIQWQFRPTLPETEYIPDIRPCDGIFFITAKDSFRKLEITAKASTDSFIDVRVPTDGGFIVGAEESFSTVVTVKGYIKLPWFGYVLVDRYEFTKAALEFGADYMCK